MKKKPEDEKLTEAEFTSQVIQLAKLHKWLVAHFRPGLTRKGRWITAMSGDVGFPDLVLAKSCQPIDRIAIGAGRVVFAELKIPPNKPTAAQLDWLSVLTAAGVEAYLWTPNDWDEIEEVLA